MVAVVRDLGAVVLLAGPDLGVGPCEMVGVQVVCRRNCISVMVAAVVAVVVVAAVAASALQVVVVVVGALAV